MSEALKPYQGGWIGGDAKRAKPFAFPPSDAQIPELLDRVSIAKDKGISKLALAQVLLAPTSHSDALIEVDRLIEQSRLHQI